MTPATPAAPAPATPAAPAAAAAADPLKPAAAAPAVPAAAAPAAGDPPAADGPVLGSGDPGDSPPGAADWPADWQDRIVTKNADKKGLKQWISRYGSIEAAIAAGFEAQGKIRSGQFTKHTLDADAPPEEVAAYRKEHGIPEAPEGYALSMPEGVAPTDADKAVLGHFADVFHKLHVPAPVAKGVLAAYHEFAGQQVGAMRTLARENTINNRATLKSEFGADYGRNVNVAKTFLDNTIGEEGRNALVDMKLADGTNLGDHPAFVKMVVQAALSQGDDTTLAQAEFGNNGAGTIEDQYNAAIQLKFTDPKAYASDAHQQKLLRLAAAKNKKAA